MHYIKKDITTVTEGIIVHGVNCQRAMGSGVAKALYTKWPKVRSQYMDIPKEEMFLGKIDFILITNSLIICNAWTQEYYGRDGRRYGSTDAIQDAFYQLLAMAIKAKLPVYMPRIGCGLAGLNWEIDVEPILITLNRMFPVPIFVCDWS